MYCQCGCGKITKIAPRTDNLKGWIKGQHFKCVLGHSPLKSKVNYKKEIDNWMEDNKEHFCNCGCGELITIRRFHFSNSRSMPTYIHGHYIRTSERIEQTIKMNKERIGGLHPNWIKDRNLVKVGRPLNFTRKQKRDIYIRDNGICQRCEVICLTDVELHHPWKANYHHVIQISLGGINEVENGQLVCFSCHVLIHSVKEKRMNCWKPKRKVVGNQQPSWVESQKVQRLPEDGTPSLITGKSVLLERDDIVLSGGNIR